MSMRYLLFGYGYCAQAVAAALQTQNVPCVAGYRSTKPTDIPAIALGARTDLVRAAQNATHWLISAPPDAEGCPIARLAQTDFPEAAPRWVGYFSTTSVYGNHDGGWVDERTALRPSHARAHARCLAERQWQEIGAASAAHVAVMRLAGIYGPRRNALRRLRAGAQRAIHKPDQVFSRIHVDDIVQTVLAAGQQNTAGTHIYNVCDDMPAPPAEPLIFAADLMGIAHPPIVPWAQARDNLSAMAREFYMDNKRVRNTRLKDVLGITLKYPDYKKGLQALWDSGEGR